jgi:transposase-like protein
MRQEVDTTKRKRRQFTPKLKADAVTLVRAGGRNNAQTARDLDLTETALREWGRRAGIEAGECPPGALNQAEREELVRLRQENKRLQMEGDILKNKSVQTSGEPFHYLTKNSRI